MVGNCKHPQNIHILYKMNNRNTDKNATGRYGFKVKSDLKKKKIYYFNLYFSPLLYQT